MGFTVDSKRIAEHNYARRAQIGVKPARRPLRFLTTPGSAQ